MFGRSKIKKGFQPKQRTHEEVEKEYGENCLQLGHKSRIVDELQMEITAHVERLRQLHKEGMSLPPKAPPQPKEPPVVDGPTAEALKAST